MEKHELCYYLQNKLKEVTEELNTTKNESTFSRLTGKYIMLLEIADDLKMDILPPLVEKKDALTADKIRSQLEEIRTILKEVSTIQDCINLTSKGFSEEHILVSFENGFPVHLEEAKKLFPNWQNKNVLSVWVTGDYNVSAAYFLAKDDFIFDIYAEKNDEYPIFVDVTLDELDEVMKEYPRKVGK